MKYTDHYVLGMDCGTTNIKAVIVDETGKIIAEASRPSTIILDASGNQEQDPNDWWRIAVEIFHSLGVQVGTDVLGRIRGISISSHTVTMLPVDRQGQAIRNAITYQDRRSVGELQYILEKVGRDRFVEIVGGQPSAAFLPSKILWYKNNEPENFVKTAWFLQANSYINYRLTGEMVTDLDQASRSQCFDMNQMCWSEEIGNVIGVDLSGCLPRVCPVDEIIGRVTDGAARETGLKSGTLVIAGCSDAMASVYAMGLSKLGEVGESSGTSSLVFAGSTCKSSMTVPVVTRPCSIKGIPWIFDAPITTTGAAIQWYIHTFAENEKRDCEKSERDIYELLNQQTLNVRPGSNGVMFFPYLLGERAPLWDDYVRAMFIGLDASTEKTDLVRAVFEGTAYALRHVVETLRQSGATCDVLKVCGGGSKSRVWSMIKASMLHCPVEVLSDNSGNVPMGDAILVGNKLGIFKDLEETAKNILHVKETIEPIREWERIYDAMFPYYVKIGQNVLKDSHEMRKQLLTL